MRAANAARRRPNGSGRSLCLPPIPSQDFRPNAGSRTFWRPGGDEAARSWSRVVQKDIHVAVFPDGLAMVQSESNRVNADRKPIACVAALLWSLVMTISSDGLNHAADYDRGSQRRSRCGILSDRRFEVWDQEILHNGFGQDSLGRCDHGGVRDDR